MSWKQCKNVLIIRPDNMGDLLMSTPAIRALKETFECRITVLTSSMGAVIAPHIPLIDEVIVADLPWIKAKKTFTSAAYAQLISQLKEKRFDAAVIFTVYSQNPLPAALLAFQADIPKRLAYCRENPYELLSDWIPDQEPFTLIHHQVERDIKLVEHIGAETYDHDLCVSYNDESVSKLNEILKEKNIDLQQPFVILHPGVSEQKREYPLHYWQRIAKELGENLQCPLILTGTYNEKHLTTELLTASPYCYDLAGELSIEMLIALIAKSSLLISVNTGTVHIAAALHTPVVVLYALTNPQHTPWKAPSAVLPFSVNKNIRSKNRIVEYVSEKMPDNISPPSPFDVLKESVQLLAVVRPEVLKQPVPIVQN